MRVLLASLLALALLSCSSIKAIVAEKTWEPLPLPLATPTLDITMRLFVIGDPGVANKQHEAVFNAMRALLPRNAVPSALLVPGDLTYPSGLPNTCKEAEERLKSDLLKDTPGNVPIYAVAGNHDHEDREIGTRPEVAFRATFFDCDYQEAAAQIVGWSKHECLCNKQWHFPSGTGVIGVRQLVGATPARKGFKLVTYDSQAALENPEAVAKEVERAIDASSSSQRVIVMAHHPLESVGSHGRSSFSAQDLGNAKYKAYIDRFRLLFSMRSDKVALTIFGHDHSLQYFPGAPSQLLSGAGAKRSGVGKAPEGGFAVGDVPALSLLELHATGGITVHLISSEEPEKFEIAPN